MLYKETLNFLWTQQVDGNTVCKWRLVAKERIPASHAMGGLQVHQPAEHAKGLQLNLLQKIFLDSRVNPRQSQLPALLQEILKRVHRPTIEDHMQQLGPIEWACTGQMLIE